MIIHDSQGLIRGWFVGNFEPTCFKTDNCEVGYKQYKAGDYEELHHHREATEITYVISGIVKMNGHIIKAGQIVVIDKKEGCDFEALTDASNIVVKIPGVSNDKYLGEYKE